MGYAEIGLLIPSGLHDALGAHNTYNAQGHHTAGEDDLHRIHIFDLQKATDYIPIIFIFVIVSPILPNHPENA